MKVVAFLPAKGSSDRVNNKNIKLLDGKPLFLHTLDKLISCDFIDEVYLDTESEEIISLACERNCEVLKRDALLSSNKTDGNQLFMNEVNHVVADIYIQVLCTSPFIDVETIRNGVEILKNESFYDSVVLVRKENFYLWENGRPSYDLNHIPNSNTLEKTITETMGLYMVRRAVALNLKRRIGEQPFLLEASPLEAVDVNWQEDFELAELIEAGRREKDNRLQNNVKALLSSAMLSDILDDLGCRNQVIRGLFLNLIETKVLGRAKTMRLRKLEKGEDFRGIYNALKSYENVVPNDVVIVENEVENYAYFGELNANLAIRSGAVGVVIGGNTRDSAEVSKLGLPVFSKGYTCQDVRKRATVDHMNRSILIDGVVVEPDDLVFGDREGVVVIPKLYEKRVINLAIEAAAKEKRILVDVTIGESIDSIIEDHGLF